MFSIVRSARQFEAGANGAKNSRKTGSGDGRSRRGPGTAVASRVCTSMPSVPRIDWSAQGGRLLVYSPGDPTGTSHVGVCDVANGLSITPVDVHGGLVGAAQIAPDASRILVGLVERVRGYGSLWQMDCRSTVVTQIVDLGARVAVSAVAESPDGRLAAAGTTPGTIHVCDRAGGGELCRLIGHTGPVSAVQFSVDGRHIVSASADGTIRLWSARTGRLIRRLAGHGQPVSSAGFLPDGRQIISSGLDGTIRLWDVMTGELMWQAEADPFWVNSVSVSPDGRRAASGGLVGSIIIWDLEAEQQLLEIAAHSAAVSAVEFSPDGQLLASASYDGTVRLWDVATILSVGPR
jgi:WD40 repeat protein